MVVKAHPIISSVKKTQREAAAFRALLEMFPEPIVGIDQHSRIRSANRKMADLLEMDIEDLFGLNIDNFTFQKTIHQELLNFTKVGKDGELAIQGPKGAVSLKTASGRKLLVEIVSPKVARIHAEDPGIGYGIVRIVSDADHK